MERDRGNRQRGEDKEERQRGRDREERHRWRGIKRDGEKATDRKL